MRVWNLPQLGADASDPWSWLPWGAPPTVPAQTPQYPGVPGGGPMSKRDECALWAQQGYTWSEDQQMCVLVAKKSWAQQMCDAMKGTWNPAMQTCDFNQAVAQGLASGGCPAGSVKAEDGGCLPAAVVSGQPSQGVTAKGNCVANGGTWNDATQTCAMPSAQTQPTWWDKQPDSTKMLVVAGAAVGTLAVGALVLRAMRSSKGGYTPNPPKRKRSRGHWRYNILWDRQTGKWRLVAGKGPASRGWDDLGLLAKPGRAYNKAMKQLGREAERVRGRKR